MTPALELRGVTRRFGGVRAVDGVSLSLAPGRLTALIGPNGAGKTTLFNIVAGAVAADGGEVRLHGEDMTGLPTHARVRRGMARTFQNLRIVPDLTVEENLRLGADARAGSAWAELLRGPRRAGPELDGLLRRVGLEARARDLAGGLSYGEGKLLELARALAARPRLLLLDEPAAGLPPAEAARMGALVREVAREGVTVLLVEHNMRLVMSIAEHIWVLASGRVIAEGSPAEVRRNPEVVAAYLGRDEDAPEAACSR